MRLNNHTERGSALVYILIAIALLAALTATFMDSSGNQVSSQKTNETITTLKSQANFIQMAIQQCVIDYPNGDPAYTGPGVFPYPLTADNPYLATPASYSNMADIRCPGNPGTSNNHARIFGGSTGKPFPPSPDLFQGWAYYNAADGVFFMTATNKTDSFLVTALNKLKSSYAKCEADVIDATGGAVNISTDGWQCLSGNYCFRVWIKSNGSAMYPNEAGCP